MSCCCRRRKSTSQKHVAKALIELLPLPRIRYGRKIVVVVVALGVVVVVGDRRIARERDGSGAQRRGLNVIVFDDIFLLPLVLLNLACYYRFFAVSASCSAFWLAPPSPKQWQQRLDAWQAKERDRQHCQSGSNQSHPSLLHPCRVGNSNPAARFDEREKETTHTGEARGRGHKVVHETPQAGRTQTRITPNSIVVSVSKTRKILLLLHRAPFNGQRQTRNEPHKCTTEQRMLFQLTLWRATPSTNASLGARGVKRAAHPPTTTSVVLSPRPWSPPQT
jgi:hypothetical protein